MGAGKHSIEERPNSSQMPCDPAELGLVDLVAGSDFLNLGVLRRINHLAHGTIMLHPAQGSGSSVEEPPGRVLCQHVGADAPAPLSFKGRGEGRKRRLADRETVMLSPADGEHDVRGFTEPLQGSLCVLDLLQLFAEAVVVPFRAVASQPQHTVPSVKEAARGSFHFAVAGRLNLFVRCDLRCGDDCECCMQLSLGQ